MLTTSEKSELSSMRAERRGFLNQITSLTSRDMAPADMARVDELYAKIAAMDARLSDLENAASGDLPASADGSMIASNGSRSQGRRSQAWPVGNSNRATGSDSEVLRAWLRHGLPCEQDRDRETLQNRGFNPSANALEFRANLSTGGSGAGAELVPKSFYAEVTRALKNVAPLRGVCKIIQSDTGETLRIPVNDDSSNSGAIVAENAEHTALDMSFTEISLGAYTYSSRLVKCSNDLLQDSGINLAQFLGQQLGERIGRIQETHFLTGTGSGQPEGVITAASTTTAASATAIGINDLIALMNAVDPAYKKNRRKSGVRDASNCLVRTSQAARFSGQAADQRYPSWQSSGIVRVSCAAHFWHRFHFCQYQKDRSFWELRLLCHPGCSQFGSGQIG